MLDLLMIGLLQAAAGEPQTPAPAEAAPQAQAQPAAPEQAESAADQADDQDRVVCRRVPRIGTRFTDRVCTTRREDERRRADDRQTLERAQSMRWGSGSN
jgi:hypothetical protein